MALTAFGALMVATNVFNNALRVDLDDYLEPYRRSRRQRHGLRLSRRQGGVRDRGGARPGARGGAGAGPGGRAHRWPSTSRGRCPTPATAWELRATSSASPPTARRRAAPARRSPPTCATTPPSAPRSTLPSPRFGRIDILFNNAGICAYGLAHELTEEAWDAMLDINLKGAWLVARRVIPVMIRQRAA